jgi:hypothetical protein
MSSPRRLAAAVAFLIGLALGCGGGGGGGGGGCGVSNDEFCAQNCFPGQNVYGCDVPSSNDRICAIDEAMAVGLCPPGSNAKFLAQCPPMPNPGTGGQGGDGADGAQGGTAATPPPGVDESADGNATGAGKR